MLPLFLYLKSSEVLRKLRVSKLIPHNKEKVYKEIADFENYVNFIPGCSKAKLIEKGDGFEIGVLEFDFLLRKYEINLRIFFQIIKSTLSKLKDLLRLLMVAGK